MIWATEHLCVDEFCRQIFHFRNNPLILMLMKIRFILLACLFVYTGMVTEQLLAVNSVAKDTIHYKDALQLQLIGKGFRHTMSPYDRLPSYLKGKVRDALWELGTNSAGLAVRFRTDSRLIAARYELTMDRVMNHMAFTGIKGLDLYCLEDDGHWRYVITARPKGKVNDLILVNNMPRKEREFMLYLPLYDGIRSLEIGVDKEASIGIPLVESPRKSKPIVIYGTSITQGGCASRPGMVYSNILSRQLDKECINLGFSGNGRQDIEIAQALDSVDASCFVIDCIPNCTLQEVQEKTLPFMRRLRSKHPDVPIIMIEGHFFPQQHYDASLGEYLPKKHKEYRKAFDTLLSENPNNLFYVTSENISGADCEDTVDGIHLTDLGFMRMAKELYPIIKPFVQDNE